MPKPAGAHRPGSRPARWVTRGWSQHRARVSLAAAVAVAGVLVGGAGAVLLLILAGMLLVDAAIPVPGTTWSEADDQVRRVVRERAQARRTRRLRGLPPERLELLDDAGGWASIAEHHPLGIQPIAVDSISGTVEAARARTFDARFRPDLSEADRWRRIWLAQARGAALPPIAVYRVAGRHIVRDGHHRVSVARHAGLETIDAEVVELRHPRR